MPGHGRPQARSLGSSGMVRNMRCVVIGWESSNQPHGTTDSSIECVCAHRRHRLVVHFSAHVLVSDICARREARFQQDNTFALRHRHLERLWSGHSAWPTFHFRIPLDIQMGRCSICAVADGVPVGRGTHQAALAWLTVLQIRVPDDHGGPVSTGHPASVQ